MKIIDRHKYSDCYNTVKWFAHKYLMLADFGGIDLRSSYESACLGIEYLIIELHTPKNVSSLQWGLRSFALNNPIVLAGFTPPPLSPIFGAGTSGILKSILCGVRAYLLSTALHCGNRLHIIHSIENDRSMCREFVTFLLEIFYLLGITSLYREIQWNILYLINMYL